MLNSIPRKLATLVVLALGAVLLAPAAPAAAAPPPELQFDRYTPVNPAKYQSLRYADDGRFFFRAGKWRCQIWRAGSVACQGKPATAPPNTLGVSVTNDSQGPWWVPPGTTFRFGSQAGFRAPVLRPGQRIVTNNVVCAVPRSGVVSCATNNRAFILSPQWHKFYGPRSYRNGNPAPRYLPAHLR